MARRARQEKRSRRGAKESRKGKAPPENLTKQVQDKVSQLARFGLGGTRGALLKPRPRKDQ